MGRKGNKHGGGSNTNKNGLAFEKKMNLLSALENVDGVEVNKNNEVFKNGTLIGLYCPKYSFYKYFLTPKGINWKDRISKQLLPDVVFVNYQTNKIYFGDDKFQKGPGSADEKIETAHYKHYVLTTLCEDLGYDIDYFYLLSYWFLKKKIRHCKNILR